MAAATFPLMRLPGELQDEIWIMALPEEPRVFHVYKAVRSQTCPKHAQHLVFHNRIPPPCVAQVCARSRAAARVAGFIQFSQPGDAPGAWFNAHTDILYFGGCMTLFGSAFRRTPKDPPPLFTTVPELRLVRHIGIPTGNVGGRYGYVDGKSRFIVTITYGDNTPLWDALNELLRSLRKRAPAATTLHYIVPMIRGDAWGTEEPWGEPVGHLCQPIIIAPMRPHDVVARAGRRTRNSAWGDVEPQLTAALESLGPGAPQLAGWFLTRVHPMAVCGEEIRRRRVG